MAKVQIKFEKRTFGDVYFGNEAFSYDVSGLFITSLLYICIIFHDSKKHQSYSVRPLGKKSPCATKRTHLYYGQQESRMVGTCVSDKI